MSTWNMQDVYYGGNGQNAQSPFSWWPSCPAKNDKKLLSIIQKLDSWEKVNADKDMSAHKADTQSLNELCRGVEEWKLICVMIDRAIRCKKLDCVKVENGIFDFAFLSNKGEVLRHMRIVFPVAGSSDVLPEGVERAARYSEFVDCLLKTVYKEYSCIIVEAYKKVIVSDPPLGEGIVLDSNTENSGISEEFQYQIDCMIRCQENLSTKETSSEYLVDTITIDLKRTNGRADWNSVEYKYEKLDRQLTSETDLNSATGEKIKNTTKEEVNELIKHIGTTEAKSKIFDCFLRKENSVLYNHLDSRIKNLREQNQLALSEAYNRNIYLNIFPLNIFISQMPQVTYKGNIRRKEQSSSVTLTLKIDALKAENLDWSKCLIVPQKDISRHTMIAVLPPEAQTDANKVALGGARFVVALDEQGYEWLTVLPAGDAQKGLFEKNHIDYAVLIDDCTEEKKARFKGQFILHSATQTVMEGTYLKEDVERCDITNIAHYKPNLLSGNVLKPNENELLSGRYYKNLTGYKRYCGSCGHEFISDTASFENYKKTHALLEENQFWCKNCDGKVIDTTVAIFKDRFSNKRYRDDVSRLQRTFLCECGEYFYFKADGVKKCARCGTLYCPDCAKNAINSSTCTKCAQISVETKIQCIIGDAEEKFIIKKARRYFKLRDRFKRADRFRVYVSNVEIGDFKSDYQEVKIMRPRRGNWSSYIFYYNSKKRKLYEDKK